MTTTELIKLLKKHEYGGATGRPREVMICFGGDIYDTNITDISTGDGLITELFLEIDSPERKKGKWEVYYDDEYPTDSSVRCTNCHAWFVEESAPAWEYCPHCGARMEM